MFGAMIVGQPVSSEFLDVSGGQCSRFLCKLGNLKSSNHLAIFLTQPILDITKGAGVYLSLPDNNNVQAEPAWQYLGFLSNEKPSAVYKIAGVREQQPQQGQGDASTAFGTAVHDASSILLGVSMEEILTLTQNTPATDEVSKVSSFVDFTQHTLENLSNYVTSFAVQVPAGPNNAVETVIPLRVFDQWWEKFQRQMQQNPYFWRK